MSKFIKPINYNQLLDNFQTEKGIKIIKDFFQQNLAAELHLRRATAPSLVPKRLGINDESKGTERAVNFPILQLPDQTAEVAHH